MSLDCFFCKIDATKIIFQDDLIITIRDAFPISLGHTLIIPKRHVSSFFATTNKEQTALLHGLNIAKEELYQPYIPNGYNIGINNGLTAGQTIPHLHIHLIPRYAGDCSDPRGGIRWLIPEKAVYWE